MISKLVLIFSLGFLVSCFPSSKESSNFINDTNLLNPKTHANKSSHKKPHSHSPSLENFLSKFDFNPSYLRTLNYSAFTDFCNSSHWEWETNNSWLMKRPESKNKLESSTVSSFETSEEETIPSHREREMNHSRVMKGPETKNKFETSEEETRPTSRSRSEGVRADDAGPVNYEFQAKKNNKTITDTGKKDDEGGSDLDNILIRILLLLILILQNVFLFVMVIFYRNMKKPGKKCIERK